MGIAEELQAAIRRLSFENNNQVFGITCSFGVTQWDQGDTIDRFLRRADLALYESKNSGRDRITASDGFSITKRHEAWRGVIRTAERGPQLAQPDVSRSAPFVKPGQSGIQASPMREITIT